MVGYWIFKNRKDSKFCLIASLPHHICKPRCQTKHRTATILWHNNKLTSEMCLSGFQRVWCLCASLFLLSSIRLFFVFFMQRNYIDELTFPINTFLELYLDATTSILKHLHYSGGIGQVQVQYFECKIQAKSALKWAWQYRYIRDLVDGSHFVLQSSASFRHNIKRLPHPFWWGGFMW